MQNKINEILNEIYVGINLVTQRVGFNDEKLRISAPKYFIELLKDNMIKAVPKDSKKTNNKYVFLFGIEVVLNYENKIVIFHEDMPVSKETLYITINLN